MGNVKKAIEVYDNHKFGPLLGVSDEGSAAGTIANAAHQSAKAKALGEAGEIVDEMCVGLIIDGERMGSAGEVPIGPDEYAMVLPAAHGNTPTFCSTNVGVRVNTRIRQPLPEFRVADAAGNEEQWLDSVFNAFGPFLHTPDNNPRPLTVRLLIEKAECIAAIRDLVPKLEAGRARGLMGSPELHRLSLLMVFDRIINSDDVAQIKVLANLAGDLGLPEVAIDGTLVEASRRRISIQGLLNILDPNVTRELLGLGASRGVQLVYHYETDPETAARTVWTGLDSAKNSGLTAAKYGLFPLMLSQQEFVVNEIQRWIASDWTPIPAFYVDTALVTDSDVFEADRCVEACRMWMDMVSKAGAKVVLIDAPDRISPHKLVKTDGGPKDPGILTIDQIRVLVEHSKKVGLKALWSGGISAGQAYDLGKLGVAGIFTTGSTAQVVAVHGTMKVDHALAAQPEPTDIGVRRIHALVGGGYLCFVLEDQDLIAEIEERSVVLRDGKKTMDEVKAALDPFNETLDRAWKKHWG